MPIMEVRGAVKGAPHFLDSTQMLVAVQAGAIRNLTNSIPQHPTGQANDALKRTHARGLMYLQHALLALRHAEEEGPRGREINGLVAHWLLGAIMLQLLLIVHTFRRPRLRRPDRNANVSCSQSHGIKECLVWKTVSLPMIIVRLLTHN